MKNLYTFYCLLMLIFCGKFSDGATHIITQSGNSFNPQTLTVNVGDIVRWVWTGGSHTTTSTSVPGGAAPWNSVLNNGTQQFEYTVTVAGDYNYECTPHAAMGMNGSFNAVELPPACAINPEITQVDNVVTVSINGTGATNPLFGISWGDGTNASNLPTDTHTYTESGTYEICVTYIDQANAEGCNVTSCGLSVVVDFIPVDECTVDLEVTTVELTATVIATGTGVVNGQYMIDWGDSTTDIGNEGSHTYSEAGTYTVCVMYGDMSPGGCVATECTEVEVEEAEIECTLSILATGTGGLTVILTSAGTGAETPNYSVDWGDNSALGTSANGTHQYEEDGEYTICVTYTDIENSTNCIVEQCTTLVLTGAISLCSVTLNVTNNNGVYTATAVGAGATTPGYLINWGDATAPTMSNSGTHTYAAAGSYEICAYYTDITNVANCTVSDCETVDVTVGVFAETLLLSNLIAIPNPLAENTQLSFSLRNPANIQIDVTDILGKKIDSIISGSRGQGSHRVEWNTQSLSSGIYIVKIMANGDQQSIKVVK